MGLAPYGEPRYAQTIRDHLIDVKDDGSFRLDMRYFNYCTGLTMTNDAFHRLFGGEPRAPESHLTQRDMDLAASIQAVTEDVVLKLARGAAASDGTAQPVPRRRRRAQLRRQRQAPARAHLRRHLAAAGGGRRRRSDRRGARRLPPAARGEPRTRPVRRRDARGVSRAFVRAGRHRAAAGRRRRALRGPERRSADRRVGARARRRQGARLASGPDGIRPAGARRPLDPRRPSFADDAEDAQPARQVPRIVQAVRAQRAARGPGRLVRPRRGQPVHAAGRRRRATTAASR